MIPHGKFTLHFKLSLSLLAMVLVTAICTLAVGWSFLSKNLLDQAHEYVSKTTDMFFNSYANRMLIKNKILQQLSFDREFQQAVSEGNQVKMHKSLARAKKENNFDILNITDNSGRVIYRENNPALNGDLVTQDLLVKYVLSNHQAIYGFDVMPRELMVKEGADLADKAHIVVIPTDRSRKQYEDSESRGLFIKAASPIFIDGNFIGVVYGGMLLNKDQKIPDQAKNLVFSEESIDGTELGTATLFLGDLRVSTTVRTTDGFRAIGTLSSEEVYQKVLLEGKTWKGRAFVVDRWYVAAYRPISDISGKIIGMIYTGILEKKYGDILTSTLKMFVLIVVAIGFLAVFLALALSHGLVQPIKNLEKAAQHIIWMGKYNKVEIDSNDEIGTLGSIFNEMIEALVQKDRILKENSDRQIQHSETLASVGRLASGVAHEINNPLTGVLTYSSTLLEELKDTNYREDLEIIRDETLRCREIVKGLLDYARETRLEKASANLNDIIHSLLNLVTNQMAIQGIQIETKLDPELPPMQIDINQIGN